MINSNSDFRKDYTVLKYDDNESYKRRILSCVNQLNDEEIILFTHEDMFLYSKPNIGVISEYINLIDKEKCDIIKLIRAFENLEKSNLHSFLYKNPEKQLFSIQPSLLKVKTLKKVFANVPGENIWEFEGNTNSSYLGNINSLCSFDKNLEQKRGKYHYDSSIYPYVCTAVIKGKWNFKEYKKELFEIFYNKKFNIFSYYLSKIKS